MITANDLLFFCPRCGYEGPAESMCDPPVIVATPWDPTWRCPQCKMEYRLAFHNCLCETEADEREAQSNE